MRVQIAREDFLKGLQAICPIIPSRSTLPILSHILLEAQKDKLVLSGTDLELAIATTISAQTQEEGATAVPAKRLNDLIRELPDTPLQLTSKKNNQLNVECENGLFKISGLPKEEFPKIPQTTSPDSLVVDQGLLQAMLNLTTFAVSRDESRYVLTGVLFVCKGSSLQLVATDGRRLALIEKEAVSPPSGEHQVIVPLKAVLELSRLLGGGPTAKVSIKENQITFDLGNTQLISHLIDGKFPNHEQVIPPEVPQKLKVSKEMLLLATRRITLWTTQDSPSIRFDLRPNQLVVSKQTPELGEAREELKVQYSGEEFSIGFNPSYLIDVLKALPDGEVEFELPGPDRPGVIRTRDHYLYIVLPMQLSA